VAGSKKYLAPVLSSVVDVGSAARVQKILNDTGDFSDAAHKERLKTGADWPDSEITSPARRVFRPTV
jgi:hypothetical protein